MAFVLNAIIAKYSVLGASGLEVVDLEQDFRMAPLGAAFWRREQGRSNPLISAHGWSQPPYDGDVDEDGNPHFTVEERARHLADAQSAFSRVASRCADLSTEYPIAYVEANFFGGGGEQASAVWIRGTLVLGPLVSALAINEALEKIGVKRGIGDEFQALGLGRHRFTENWLRPNEK
jgi:hypothetical protein